LILVDTGPIVAAAFTTERHHAACVEMFTRLRRSNERLLLPATVAAEAGYLIDRLGGARREVEFLEGVADGGLEPVDLSAQDYRRMAELATQYGDMRLGTTDASVIALAERLSVTEIATLDRRHFTPIRPRHATTLTLLPEPL
jgi:uncharacterized protein